MLAGMSVVLAACGALMLASCGTQTQESPQSNPSQQPDARHTTQWPTPPPSLQPPWDTLTLDAETGGTWVAPDGTQLVVPPNAWADALSNNPIPKGPVVVLYRGLHSAADLWGAGLGMGCAPCATGGNDALADSGQLASAGVFQLKAMAGGLPARLRRGKAVRVAFASRYPGPDYDVYRYDTAAQRWQLAQRAAAVEMEPLGDTATAEQGALGELIIDEASVATWPPQLRPFAGQAWHWRPYDATPKDSLAKALNTVWTAMRFGEADPNNPTWTRLTLTRAGKRISLYVRPVAGTPRQANSPPPANGGKPVTQPAKETGANGGAQALAQAFRTVEVTELGSFNFDRLLKMGQDVALHPLHLHHPGQNMGQLTVYALYPDLNTVARVAQLAPGRDTALQLPLPLAGQGAQLVALARGSQGQSGVAIGTPAPKKGGKPVQQPKEDQPMNYTFMPTASPNPTPTELQRALTPVLPTSP